MMFLKPSDILSPLKKDYRVLTVKMLHEITHTLPGNFELNGKLIEFSNLLHVIKLTDVLMNNKILLIIQVVGQFLKLENESGQLGDVCHGIV